MATEIYQSNAGYLWVEDREIPLSNAQWVYSTNNGYDYITILSGDNIVLKNSPLRHIVNQAGSGYSNLAEFREFWDALITSDSDMSEISSQITSQYIYSTDPISTRKLRIGIRGDSFVVDKELTETGFTGTESDDDGITGDWINISYIS